MPSLSAIKTQDFTSNRVGPLLPPALVSKSLAAKLATSLVTSVYPARGGTF